MGEKYTKITIDYVEKKARNTEIIWLIISLAAFAGITYLVVTGKTARFDQSWLIALSESRAGWMTTMMELFTYIGTWQAIVVVCLLLLMYRNTMLSYGIPVSIAGIIELIVNHAIKVGIARPRPDDMYMVLHEGGYSYPSGHACAAFAVYFLLALLVIKYIPKYRGSPRKSTSALLVTVAVMIGVSRAYLGMHYVTDVVGGQLLGLAIAMVVMLFWGWVARKKNIEVARRVSPAEGVDFAKVKSERLKDSIGEDKKKKKSGKHKKLN
ncbi:MAG: phosphatase PAP2 family protein [Anaerovoracaceae bacterium]|nr:phosphatase PAP2 family protein [Anaerovoracaceae bacterium]